MIPRNLVTPIAISAVALSLATYLFRASKESAPLDARPMAARHLPGFTIALPDGSKEVTTNLDYVAGALEVRFYDRDASARIGWQYGTVPDEAGLLQLGRGVARLMKIHSSSARIVPGAGSTVTIGDEMYMSVAPCGMRLIVVASALVGWNAHAKIVKSIVCHPDPERENGDAAIPVAIDLPGYQAVVRYPGQLTLESDTTRVVMRRAMSASPRPTDVKISPEFGKAILIGLGLDGTLGAPHGDILTFTAKFDEGDQPGRVRSLVCGSARILIAALAVDGPAIDDVEKRIAAAHCLAPGEAAPTWPDAQIADDDLDDGLHDDELEGSGSAQP